MKFILQLIAIALGALILEMVLPWWSIAIAAFAFGYLLKSNQNFLAGFFAIALLWATYAFTIDAGAATPLASRVAAIFSMNKTLLFLVAALVGGLVGGFAALCGSLLKRDKRKSLYY